MGARIAGRHAWATVLWALALLLAPGVAGAEAPAASATQPAATEHIAIVLHALHGDAVLYTGRRTISQTGGRVTVRTEFLSPAGAVVQRTEGVFNAGTLAPLSWHLDDLRSGEAERIERHGETIELRYRLTGKDTLDSTTLTARHDLVFTPTVEPLILRDWDRLLAGKTVSFRLLVPSRLDSYSFRIQRDTTPALQQPGRVVLRMEPDSWFVRRLVDPLYFVFDAQAPHALREFRGRSSIRTDAGKTQDLRMDFRLSAQG